MEYRILPQSVVDAAAHFLGDQKTALPRKRFLLAMLQGMTTYPVPEAALVRALEDMAVAGADFRPVVVRTWTERAQKLLEGEAGAKAAREALKQRTQAIAAPSAYTGPSEDDLE